MSVQASGSTVLALSLCPRPVCQNSTPSYHALLYQEPGLRGAGEQAVHCTDCSAEGPSEDEDLTGILITEPCALAGGAGVSPFALSPGHLF